MPEPPTPTLIHSADEPRSGRRLGGRPPQPPRNKPKLKKLRLAFVLLGLAALALVSTVFGMLMAVSSDLPALENQAEFDAAKNSELYADADGQCKDLEPDKCPLMAKLTGNNNRILLGEGEISPHIKNAVIAIEDRRFYEHEGVDYKGIARAFIQDIRSQSAAQGGSTITQQFVKNALSAQGERSVFQKLREAALAYHLERKWTKEKVLTQYLNSVYFGNGAYGVESAVRTYFRNGGDDGTDDAAATGVPVDPAAATDEPDGEERREARYATPAEAALLAGMISSPSMYNPVENPRRATQRRNYVLDRMLEQGMITRQEHDEAVRTAVPDDDEVSPPRPESDQPYFSSWLTQQLVDRYGAGLVFGGGLKIKTTLDPELQYAAEQAIAGRLTGVGPDASLVAIENKTGEVKAMVGGANFDEKPFNLATNGHRQPGSAFKPFILVRALADNVSPDATFASQQKQFRVPGSPGERFVVNNYEDTYYGIASLRAATAASDNSVYAELGIDLGTRRVARMARRMGLRTKVSTNPAMTLGGLEEGLTPLEVAYAYSTIANKGLRVSGTLSPDRRGPVGIQRVEGNGIEHKNDPVEKRVFNEKVGEVAQQLLAGVVTSGTGKAAQVGDEFIWGKTGTTENYGDAWFVGSNNELTVAVWVGYADRLQPMETEYSGGPVAGGTYPAEIFHDFMTDFVDIREQRELEDGEDEEEETTDEPYVPPVEVTPPPAEEQAPVTEEEAAPAPAPAPEEEQAPAPEPPPQEPAPTPAPAPAPAPAPTPAPGAGGDQGGANAPGE